MGSSLRTCFRSKMARMRRRDLLKGLGAGAMLAAVSAASGGDDGGHGVRAAGVSRRMRVSWRLLARFRDHTVAIFERHGMRASRTGRRPMSR